MAVSSCGDGRSLEVIGGTSLEGRIPAQLDTALIKPPKLTEQVGSSSAGGFQRS